MLGFNGFQVLYPQVSPLSWIFVEHPDTVVDFRPKNQVNAQIINVRCSSSVWSNLDSNPEKQSRALFMASKAE
ncbi:hypothetical protein F2Q70_00024493 [Brassica cretica]|uniref:Uncharacterized protein n=1 Tax=Brassica cretica TaxID=69181 RepID=A0A8S9LDX7_BRACR|nr:hypothetical protein F2Q70_00024493 [Brassica cretica]